MAHSHLLGFTLARPLAKGPALPSTQLPLVPPRLLFQAGFCDLSGSPMTWASLLPLPSPQHVLWEICWPTKWPGSASDRGGVPSHGRNPSSTSPYSSLDWTTSKPTTAWREARGLPQRENEKPGPQPLPTRGGQRPHLTVLDHCRPLALCPSTSHHEQRWSLGRGPGRS